MQPDNLETTTDDVSRKDLRKPGVDRSSEALRIVHDNLPAIDAPGLSMIKKYELKKKWAKVMPEEFHKDLPEISDEAMKRFKKNRSLKSKMKREEKAKEKNVNSSDRKRLKHGETTEKVSFCTRESRIFIRTFQIAFSRNLIFVRT
jgi:hypothetical protein